MEDCAISGNVSDRSVALVEGEEWNVWGVFRCMCEVAVDCVCAHLQNYSFGIIE